MEQFDAAIIGFGTAGLALGGALADDGQNIVVVEQSDTMYGGACVNNACIPTKALVESARLTAAVGGSIVEREERYTAAVDDMKELRSASRERNYRALADRENVDVIDGRASFANATHLTVATASGTRSIEAKRIFIDTGSLPKLPSIPGIDSPRVFVSSSLIELPTLPRQLVIIGGGYVGLEFASFYTDFGAQVTILQNSDAILAHEDPETAEAVRRSLEDRGVTIVYDAHVTHIDDEHDQVLVFAQVNGEEKRYPGHAVLVAVGRTPNTTGLNLEAAGIELNDRGGIKVDEHLRTTADNVWAMGDVTGGMQFTYIAYDDYRIVASDLLGDGTRTTSSRGAIPYAVFTTPPFARVGMTEDEAREDRPFARGPHHPRPHPGRADRSAESRGGRQFEPDTGHAPVLHQCARNGEPGQDRHGRAPPVHHAARRHLHPSHHGRIAEQPVRRDIGPESHVPFASILC